MDIQGFMFGSVYSSGRGPGLVRHRAPGRASVAAQTGFASLHRGSYEEIALVVQVNHLCVLA